MAPSHYVARDQCYSTGQRGMSKRCRDCWVTPNGQPRHDILVLRMRRDAFHVTQGHALARSEFPLSARSGSSSSGSKSLRSGRSLTLLDCLTPPLRCLLEATGSVGRLVIAQRKWNVGIESVLSLRLMCARLFGTTLAQTLKPETLASPCQSKKCEAQLNKVGRAADSPNAKRPWPQPLRSRPAGGRTRSPLATGSGTARRLPER
jgi:hypothetical protein